MHILAKSIEPISIDMGMPIPNKVGYNAIVNFVKHHPDAVFKKGKYWCVKSHDDLNSFRNWLAYYAKKYSHLVEPTQVAPVQASEPSVKEMLAQLKDSVQKLREAGYTVNCSVVAKPIEY
jgi:predicted metal-dependent hydrolase